MIFHQTYFVVCKQKETKQRVTVVPKTFMFFSHDFRDVKTAKTSSFLGCFFWSHWKRPDRSDIKLIDFGSLGSRQLFYLDLFKMCFFTFYHGKSPWNKPPFGRIFLELFPSIEQTNPSFVWRDCLLDGLPWCHYTRMILTRTFASWVWYGNFRDRKPRKKSEDEAVRNHVLSIGLSVVLGKVVEVVEIGLLLDSHEWWFWISNQALGSGNVLYYAKKSSNIWPV